VSISSTLAQFRRTIERLREPETGCPWDLKQTHASLKKYFLEEVYEFLNEVDSQNSAGMEEELGDVLLQIYLHAQLLTESSGGEISLETIAQKINQKIIRRHPHVFEAQEPGAQKSLDASDVEVNWKKIKASEKSVDPNPFHRYRKDPPLQKVEKIYRDVKGQGFRFKSPLHSLDKVQEELNEVLEQVDSQTENNPRLKEEFGDLVLSVFSSAVEFGFSPEELLQSTLRKFSLRWERFQDSVETGGVELSSLSYNEKERYWIAAKNEL
jgi:tetrapyrrole methylase family protein / MazG family protein